MAKWKVIKINTVPDLNKFRTAVGPLLEKEVVPAQKDFQDFVGTWKDKPVIKLTRTTKLSSIEVFTGVISNYKKGKKVTGEDKMFFVARGTDVRYVKMTHDFIAKTQKGVIKSGAGRGGVAKKTILPYPGIDARDIEKTVRRAEEKKIIAGYKRAVLTAVYLSGGKKI